MEEKLLLYGVECENLITKSKKGVIHLVVS